MIIIKHKGNFNKTEKFLAGAKRIRFKEILESYAKQGVNALSSATPVDSGLTSSSWGYNIITTNSGFRIEWTNSNVVSGVPIAIILQYGHGTRNGGWVQGRDYINPAIAPIFADLTEALWKEVTKL